MATPTSRRAAPADELLEERDTLCAELITLEREGMPRVTRVAAIEADVPDEALEDWIVDWPLKLPKRARGRK